jgi:hypothetical protein
MATLAIFCNGVVCAITGMIILTDGLPIRGAYLVLTLLMLLVPPFTAVWLVVRRRVIRHSGADAVPGMMRTDRAAVALNVALFAAAASSAIAQYPYAEGGNLLSFAVLAVSTPLLNLAAILTSARRSSRKPHGSTLDRRDGPTDVHADH